MSSRNSSNTSLYTNRVLQGSDRIYRWKYTLTREQALVGYRFMLKLSAIIATLILVILIGFFFAESVLIKSDAESGIIFSFANTEISMNLFRNLWIVPVIYLILVGLPALIGYLMLDGQTRSYEMNDKFIRHKHALKGGADAVITFEKIKWAEETGNTFRLKEGITTYTVYVPIEDAPFVKNYIRVRMNCDFRVPKKYYH